MKILDQNRSYVLDSMNQDFYISQAGEVIAMREKEIILGNYLEENRAREVLKELFGFLRCKKPCYAMPEE